MKYSVIYLWNSTSYKLNDMIPSTISKFTVESVHLCNISLITYTGALCRTTKPLIQGHSYILPKLYDLIIHPLKNLSYIIMKTTTHRHMIVFYSFPKHLIDTPVDYHRWIWNKKTQKNWILLPNLKNDPKLHMNFQFKKFTTIKENDIKYLNFDDKYNFTHPNITFRFYVDTYYPISLYDSQGILVLGQNLQNGSYINWSIDLDIKQSFKISCNDIISRKTPPIVRISIGIYNQTKFLFSDQMIFRIAPLIFTPNCLPTDTLYLSEIHGTQNTLPFIKDVTDILKQEGQKYTIVKNDNISMYHRWMQDILRFCYVTDGENTSYIVLKGPRFNMHSTKNGNISYIYDYFKEYPLYEFFYEKDKNLDAFGNVQMIPPIHPKYPFGRIIYGYSDGIQENMSYSLVDVLESQQIQKPVKVNTGWLAVGHVDEILSFVPDPNHRMGFRTLIASPRKFYQLIAHLPPETIIFDNIENYYVFNTLSTDVKRRFVQKYENNKDSKCIYNSQLKVKDILNWTELIENNNEYQTLLDHNKKILMSELNMKSDEFYEVPIYYWPKSLSSRAKSILPNMINNLYMNKFMLVPKPFGPKMGNTDLFERHFISLIPESIKVYFIHNWSAYYLLEGDINCGTNVKRQPFKNNWWSYMPEGTYNI